MSPMTDEVVLSAENVVKHFPITEGILFKRTVGQVKAVDGVSWSCTRARPSAWWVSPAAASRPWPAC